MLSAWLKHEDHHVVETAKDGEQALELLLAYPFDCVVMDWEMPKLDGIEVCRRVREKNKEDTNFALIWKRVQLKIALPD